MNRNDSLLMQEIVKQLKNDNLDMFDEFYDLTKNQVYVTILSVVKNKMTAEDIMQDTYLRFLNNIHKYKENTNVVAFIVTIARNLAINYYNKHKKEEFHDFSLYEDTYVNETEDNKLLDLVYQTLEGKELDVFIMHVIDDLKHKEIAKIMKKPLGTITWLYNKAVKKMKEKVGEENE
ncbi:MAG: RNA polymerase sigma factor [Acholeplasmataceae bacterium]|nr:RNA polymerase sigma factor [Acholeplasmataceae bacterium]